jgi:phosphoglycolate phosphatase-like HAD superfamily hydrolase
LADAGNWTGSALRKIIKARLLDILAPTMRVFLFDIDGTLVSTGGAGKAALDDAFAAEFNVPFPGDVPVSGRTDRGIARSLFELHGIEDTGENWARFRKAYIARLSGELPKRQGRVLPGVSELLALLQSRAKTAVGLLTGNVPEGARLKLEHYGIYHHFAFGGYGDRDSCRNEVARAALDAARLHVSLPLAGDQVWVLGDTPHDITCARAIGARVVAVATGTFTAAELEVKNPDLLVADLGDTQKLADKLLGGEL